MSVNVKFKVGIKKNINTSFNVENKEPIRTIFRINSGTAAFSSILGSPYDNTALAAALDLKADKTTVAGQIETVTDLINLTSETLDNKIDSVQSLLSGDISTLSETVESYNAATNQRIDDTNTTVADNFTTLNGKIEINTQAISDLTQTVADNYNTVNNRIDGIVTSFDGDISNLENAIQNEATTRANADTALQGNINTLSNTVTNNYNTLDTKIDNTKTAIDGDISDLSDTVTNNYNSLDARITANTGNIAINASNITTINSKIPNQASSSNQLADKDFVNSSIATNTAYFIGTFNSVAELEAYTGTLTNNDYAFVVTTDTAGNTLYDRYKYNANTQEWMYEYELNNSSFTAAQWNSINSGATSTNIGQIAINANNIADLQTNKQDVISDLTTIRSNALAGKNASDTITTYGNIVTHNVSEFATSSQGALADTALQPNDNITELVNNAGYITSADLPTNYVTTDTTQDISGRKTFLGEKAIYFKQTTAANKLGFTLYNPNNIELGALEYRPNTINGASLLALNCPQLTGGYVGFRYWGTPAVNIIAPKVANAGNYYIPINFTDGKNTITSNNVGTVNISRLLPDVSGFATQAWVQNQNYLTSSALNGYATQTWVQNQNYITATALNGYATESFVTSQGYITSSALNGYATESFVTSQGYITGITSSDVTTALGYTPYSNANPNNYTSNIGTVTSVNGEQPDSAGNVVITIPDSATWGNITGTLSDQTDLQTALNGKQATLVSGTNIKTVNGQSLLGSGNISVLQNTATGSGCLTIEGNPSTSSNAINIGSNSTASGGASLAIGRSANTKNTGSMAIGHSAIAMANYAIQLGFGTNSTASSLSVGFNAAQSADRTNWQLLDGITGIIPYERINAITDSNAGGELKYWTGTKAQYDAIVTKNATTLYFLSDVGKIYFGDTLISNRNNGSTLFDFKWSDHELDDMSWSRADTFSWQSGDTYTSAYNHLVTDIQGKTAETDTINGITITFYRATDGHKICLADQESVLLNLYNTVGVAWYYLLDTANTQFKFPRTKYGFEGLRSYVGNMINESLPNVTGHTHGVMSNVGSTIPTAGAIYEYQAFQINAAGTGSAAFRSYGIDASRSSSTYQDNAPVQERATQMYLYFYVGDYSQSAIEQTAGLNAELFNNKADRDLSNLSTTGQSILDNKADVSLSNVNNTAKILMSGMGMPSARYIDLTFGVSGTRYTAPANGWFIFSKRGTGAGQWITADCGSTRQCYTASINQAEATIYMAVKKGDVLTLYYDLGGENTFSRFIYAQGSESEAN